MRALTSQWGLQMMVAAGLTVVATGGCGSAPVSKLVDEVYLQRYQQDLERVAAAPREPGSAHWREIQQLCADRLAQLGYEVRRQDYGTGTNVIGILPGTSRADEQLVLSAHYDSVPGCVGADDNGSGVAGLLEGARVLATLESYPRTLVVACWDEEERGLIGSEHYARAARAAGDRILLAYVFEMIGYRDDAPDSQQIPPGLDVLFPAQYGQIEQSGFRGDFIALVYDDAEVPRKAAIAFERAGREVNLPVLSLPVPATISLLAPDLRRSDHSSFWDEELSGMMITDTSEYRNTHYHCRDGDDSVDRLDASFATKVVQATVGSIHALLDP